jgi:hypothetical protein
MEAVKESAAGFVHSAQEKSKEIASSIRHKAMEIKDSLPPV